MVKDGRIIMHGQSENFKKEIEILRKHQLELTDLIKKTNELQSTIAVFSNRLDEADERFRK